MKIRSYEWQFDPADFNRPDLQAYLEDKYLNLQNPISLTTVTVIPFSVSADQASAAPDRFRILFAPASAQPVMIYALKAYEENSGIKVGWTTKYEHNVDHYEIEKSADGRQFTKAATLNTHPGSSVVKSYSWLDAHPNEGHNYYRVKEWYTSGNVSYSEVVDVKTGDKKESFEVFPNPVTDNHLTVQFN